MLAKAQVKFFIFIVVVTTIGQMSAEIYLPSLPYISRDLNAHDNLVQLTITGFLLGMAIPGIIFGYVSDYIGRRIILIISASIGLLGTFLCAIAPNIYFLIFGRILQGVGFSGTAGIGRAILRDRLNGIEFAKYAAYLSMATALTIDLTPFFGGIIQQYFSWRIIFLFLLLYNILVIFSCYKYKEIFIKKLDKIVWTNLFVTCKIVLKDRNYIRYMLISSMTYAMFMAYLAVISFIVQEVLGYSPAWFGSMTLILSFVFVITCFINGKMLKKTSIFVLIKSGLLVVTLTGILLISYALTHKLTIELLIIGILPLFIGSSFIMSNTDAVAFLHITENVGIASALANTFRLTTSVIFTGLISLFKPNTTLPLGIILLVLCGISLFLVYFDSTQKEKSSFVI